MAGINRSAIAQKVKAFEQSEAGKAKIRGALDGYVRGNKKSTSAGGKVLTEHDMRQAGEKLVQMIRQTAAGYGIAESVQANIDSLECGELVKHADGSYTMEISFTDDLTRASLQPERYGGVTNIVALFNNGYPKDAGKAGNIAKVRGMWHGKMVRALPVREGLHFMQGAVDDFNANYGASLDIYASLSAVYEE